MPTANQIARMQAVAQRYMPDTVTVQSMTVAVDGSGGANPTWHDTAAAGIPARIEPYTLRSLEGHLAARETEIRKWSIFLPGGTVVDGTMRIKQTKSAGITLTSPRYYSVETVQDGSFEIERHLKCAEIPPPS